MCNYTFNPIFSVITVTFNAETVLEQTIKSVISQSYPFYEYIIIDGESKDGTKRVIEKYLPKIHKFVCEPDKGLYDAMNKAIDLASGHYLLFLNAGDCLHTPQTLSQIAKCIQPPDIPDVIYGDTAIVNAQRKFIRMRRLTPPNELSWQSFKHGMLVCHQAFITSRVLAKSLPGYNLRYRFSADFDWCIRILKHSRINLYTRLILIDYQQEGLTSANHWASLKERFRIMCVHYGFIPTVLRHLWFALRLLIKH